MLMYLGMGIIAFSSLALEIAIVRLLSVTTWYYLAFFAISTAMLGMTAAAVTVYRKPDWFNPQKRSRTITWAALGYAVSVPCMLIILCLVPMDKMRTVISQIGILVSTLMCCLPFYFSGLVVTSVLTRFELPPARIYASDLLGAALGCLFVLGGLELFDAPSFIILCGGLGALAALCFAARTGSRRLQGLGWTLFIALGLLAVVNTHSSNNIRPMFVKGQIEDTVNNLYEAWNSHSRVIVYKPVEKPPQLWQASPKTPQTLSWYHHISIDGGAGTGIRKMAQVKDLDYLRYDITAVAYSLLKDPGKALVIGLGGGKDVQTALVFGCKSVLGIDINAILVKLLQGPFRVYAGLADHPGVKLVADEARSYVARNPGHYAIIQMSLIDTWAATATGAFSLSENLLYTVEAWKLFYSQLDDNGFFTVSRWFDPTGLGETGRVVSLAVETLLQSGVAEPSRQIAMVTHGSVSTLIISRSPFSPESLLRLQTTARDLEFDVPILPGQAAPHPVLRSILAARTHADLMRSIAHEPFNYAPPTDENPYFFNMLRLSHLKFDRVLKPGIVRGNLTATITLLGLIAAVSIVAVGTIIIPLVWHSPKTDSHLTSKRLFWGGAIYFSLIGAGFMLTEIGLIQKLSVFLGHPIYALGVLLFTLIASTSLGSFLTEGLSRQKNLRSRILYPVLTALAIAGLPMILQKVLRHFVASPLNIKIMLSIGIIFPLGILLGFFFPTGMNFFAKRAEREVPWYWGLNGIFSVLCSALAVFISIYMGISVNFYLAATCYGLLVLVMMFTLPAEPTTAG
jgi:hypothetical protein